MTLLKEAVKMDKTMVLVVMQYARWGEKRDKTFPENSFNPSCVPFVPEVKPAFAEIAVTWELDCANRRMNRPDSKRVGGE
eukprot:6288263-Prymnesium_polylepis.1